MFTSESSTVQFLGAGNQFLISGGDSFNNLMINNFGAPAYRIELRDDVTVTNTLKMDSGFVQTEEYTLYLFNKSFNSLIYKDNFGSRVIGKFERGMDSDDEYLFPLGSSFNYNPLHN